MKGNGKGGRNQQLVLNALSHIEDALITSFDSDGWDNTPFAGAIGDSLTVKKARERGVSLEDHLKENSSYDFFEKVEDGISTDRLRSNVSDIMIVYKP